MIKYFYRRSIFVKDKVRLFIDKEDIEIKCTDDNIINIRNEINKSFFFINIKPPFKRKLASTQQFIVFPNKII